MNRTNRNIITFPHKPGFGGPGSFQLRITSELRRRGWKICYAGDKSKTDLIFIVGSTKKIFWLIAQKLRGKLIVHRLDGRHWHHTILPYPLRIKIRASIINLITKFIYYFISDVIIYQSFFVKKIWNNNQKEFKKEHIIYNSVDTSIYKPVKRYANDKLKLLSIEGSFPISNNFINPVITLSGELEERNLISETILVGKIEGKMAQIINEQNLNIKCLGRQPREAVQKLYKNCIFLVLEINPPCPNTVIEALACGIPILGFNTGSMKELVLPGTGELAKYIGNPWEMVKQDCWELLELAIKIINNWDTYSENARKSAVENFDIKNMLNHYINSIERIH